jgi:hypothetical protein
LASCHRWRRCSQGWEFANFSENHYLVKASIRAAKERLLFIASFHHVGRELTGIIEATAFSRLESFEDSEDRDSAHEKFFLCSIEPFVFTHQTDIHEVDEAFDRWLDQALAVAIKKSTGTGCRLHSAWDSRAHSDQ